MDGWADGRAWLCVAVTLLLFGCDPGTTRPDLLPFPEATTIEVVGDRPTAIEALRVALVADSFPVARVVARDAWLETPWFDAATLRPAGATALGPGVVKLRGWAEPSRFGRSLIVVELAYRLSADPSVPTRTLERPVPASDPVHARVARLLDRIEGAIGAHQGEAPAH